MANECFRGLSQKHVEGRTDRQTDCRISPGYCDVWSQPQLPAEITQAASGFQCLVRNAVANPLQYRVQVHNYTHQ